MALKIGEIWLNSRKFLAWLVTRTPLYLNFDFFWAFRFSTKISICKQHLDSFPIFVYNFDFWAKFVTENFHSSKFLFLTKKMHFLANYFELWKGVKRTSSLLAPIMLLEGHEGEIYCGKFSRDGKTFVSGGFDRHIMYWEVFGECLNYHQIPHAHKVKITFKKVLKIDAVFFLIGSKLL